MRKTSKKVLSLICALSIMLTALGNITLAATYTADDVKGMVDALIAADVNLDTWAANEDAVMDADAVRDSLDETESATFAEMKTAEDKLYSAILDEFVLIVEVGDVYDGIMALPADEYDLITGKWNKGIDETNYQDWYEDIVDLSVNVDSLTTEQQRVLGATVLARYSTAAEELAYQWFDYVEKVACALKNVCDSNVAWETKSETDKLADYQAKRAQYEKAMEKVAGLYTTDDDQYEPDQLDDVNAALVELGLEKNAEEILADAALLLETIYDDCMAAIVAIKDEIVALLPVTVDNCVEVNTKAVSGLDKYAALEAGIGANYWDALKDDALKAELEGYRDDSQNMIDAKAFVDAVAELEQEIEEATEITKENYAGFDSKYDVVVTAYEALSDAEKVLDVTVQAKADLDVIGDSLATFAADWVAEVETLIDAIGAVEHSTRNNQEAWDALVEKINTADSANNALVAAGLTADNADVLAAAKTKKAEIDADYEVALPVINAIKALGTVGDLATDDIKLDSREAIDAAKALYAALTDNQKILVTNSADLDTADAECAELEAKKAEIEGYIADFEDAKASVEYITADTDIDTAEAAADVAYTAAVAIADDEATYYIKLADLVLQLKSDYDKFKDFVAAIRTIREKGAALIAAVDAISALVDIRTEEDVAALLVAYAITADKINEMHELFATAGSAVAAYEAAKADSAYFGVVPVGEEPYATYEADKAYYEAASTPWYAANPVEAVAAVDEWIGKVETLFNEIEDKCQADLDATIEEYEALVEEYESFETIAQNYLYSQNMAVLSKYDYIRNRIGQYENAKEIIDAATNAVLPELPVVYNGDFAAYETAVAQYEVALNTAGNAIASAYIKYNTADQPTKEIPGVNDAYVLLEEKEAERLDRVEALAFDKAVIAAYKADVTVYADVLNLKAELEAESDGVKAAVTSEALLVDAEIKAVEDLIKAIGTFTFDDVVQDRATVKDKIVAARNAYDALNDDMKVAVSNYDVLEAAELLLEQIDSAIAFIEAVDALEVVDASNWEAVKANAEALREDYNEFDDVTKGMVGAAYTKLQKKQAEVVSFMLSVIPDVNTIRGYQMPDDIDDVDALIELLSAIERVEDGEKKGAYRELTTYAKLMVVGYASYGIAVDELKAKVAEYNQSKADEVVAVIETIGYAEGVMTADNYETYLDAIETAEAASEAYEADRAARQATFAGLVDGFVLPNLVTNSGTMDDARIAYDIWAAAEESAAEVVAALDTFLATYATTDAVNEENYETVVEACDAIEEAWGELDEKAKKFVDVTVLEQYREKANEIARYMDVVKAIDELIYDEDGTTTSIYEDIISNGAIAAEYGVLISELEAKFEDLTVEERAKVSNYSVLTTARETYDGNIAAAVEDTIEAIEAIFEVAALEDFAVTNAELETAIDMANEFYASLPEVAQAEVTNAADLVAANEKLASLTQPDAVIAAINELGNPEEIEVTDENYSELSANVAAARALYDSLAVADKEVVNNLTTLTVWEEKIAAFEPDYSGDLTGDGEVNVDDITLMVDTVLRRIELDDVQFERANLVVDEGETQVINIFDILAVIELIVF